MFVEKFSGLVNINFISKSVKNVPFAVICIYWNISFLSLLYSSVSKTRAVSIIQLDEINVEKRKIQNYAGFIVDADFLMLRQNLK